MNDDRPVRVLLGPQSPRRNLGEAFAKAGLPDGPIAVISAGWQEAEGDIDEIADLIDREVEDLQLYRRNDEVMSRVPDLAVAMRRRQDRLTEQQRMYRQRLKQLGLAARQTLRFDGDADLVAAEQRHAVAQLRALDRHHLHRCESIWHEFRCVYNAESDAQIRHHAAEIAAILDRSAGVVITGGNVAVLINRMRLFGVGDMLDARNIVAWSAGAMVLADRIVLFHDRSPEGRRDPEVLGAGCGILPGYVFLPDTQHRLRAGDRLRIELFCKRFSPDVCATLDNGAELHFRGGEVSQTSAVRRLAHDGAMTGIRAA